MGETFYLNIKKARTILGWFFWPNIPGPYLPDNSCSDILLLDLPGAGDATAIWLLATACCATCAAWAARAAAEGRVVKGRADDAANENSLKQNKFWFQIPVFSPTGLHCCLW